MQFHVGPYVYRLVVSDRAIFDEEGNELEGLAVEGRRLLILSYRVEPERREEVAIHELMHAWLFAVPTPRTDEERCNLTAMVARQYRADVEHQGGEEAIRQLVPIRVPHLGRPVARPVASAPAEGIMGGADRVPCGCCGADVMCGSIHNGQPEQHEATGRWQMERWCECEACGSLLAWGEYCTPDGAPLGQYVSNPPPQVLRGRDAAAWVAGRRLAVIP